jgi:hypothetical protein
MRLDWRDFLLVFIYYMDDGFCFGRRGAGAGGFRGVRVTLAAAGGV